MDRRYSLSEMLSFALVAFTIEFDNELELQVPHITTRYGATAGATLSPWLISMAMYQNCLQHLTAEGITLRELERRARTGTNLDGMQRWGLIIAVPTLDLPLPRRTRNKPRPDWFLLPTKGGRITQQVCQPLFGVIESRWQSRFGETAITALRKSLREIAAQLDPDLPDCMPILGYGLAASSLHRQPAEATAPDQATIAQLPLPALLARVLLAFANEFESESQVSIAICANVLRVAGEPVLLRDLPRLSGASKEAIAVATGFLSRHGFADVATSPGSRNKALTLTAKGQAARQIYLRLIPEVESRWRTRYGSDAIDRLLDALFQLVAESPEQLLPLRRGLDPQPGNWRSKVPRPETLPHYPLVLHRGGYPDGS